MNGTERYLSGLMKKQSTAYFPIHRAAALGRSQVETAEDKILGIVEGLAKAVSAIDAKLDAAVAGAAAARTQDAADGGAGEGA